VSVQLSREYFSEALKLSDEEIDGFTTRQCAECGSPLTWKAHYTGDIAFFRGAWEDPKRESVTSSDSLVSISIELARCCLSGRTTEAGQRFGVLARGRRRSSQFYCHTRPSSFVQETAASTGVFSSGHSYKPAHLTS